MKKILFIIFLILIIICYFLMEKYKIRKDNFNSENNKIFSYNVITLYHVDRLNNIKEQEKILPNIKISKFNAIKGMEINQNELIKLKILSPEFALCEQKRSNEIGCYSSHLELLKSLRNTNYKYHIILEDDFKFVDGTDFIDSIKKIIEQTKKQNYQFDIIFLGWNSNINKLLEEQIDYSENLFKFNSINSFYGTYGYMVNSNSLEKIINLIEFIDMPIDIKYNKLHSENKLNIYWSKQKLIEHNYILESTILINK